MRYFSARETEWLQKLDGIELASFPRRALAFAIDLILIGVLLLAVGAGFVLGYLKVREMRGHPTPPHAHFDIGPGSFDLHTTDPTLDRHVDNETTHLLINLGVPILYFGLLTWAGKGRSPGKWVTRIRVVSLVHRHLTLWHSIERALGYAAATLEFGFGFLQFFIHPYRRTVQDRIAETIVVAERSFRTHLRQGLEDRPDPPHQSSSITSST